MTTWRRGWDRFEVGRAAWIVLGVPVFLVQHWWIYQYAMFLVPIGIFAGHGLDALCRAWCRWGRARVVALLTIAGVLALPMLLRVGSNVRDVTTHGFAASVADRASLRADIDPITSPRPRGHDTSAGRDRHHAACTCSGIRSTSTVPIGGKASRSTDGRPSSTPPRSGGG